jgi:biotin carboxyl carrier protein
LKNSLKFKITVDSKTHEIEVKQQNGRTDPSSVVVSLDGKPFIATIVERDESCRILRIRVNEKEFKVGLNEMPITGRKPLDVTINEIPFEVDVDTLTATIGSVSKELAPPKKVGFGQPEVATDVAKAVSGLGKVITPPMPGKVIAVKVKEGDTVKLGDVVLILEAMKMANEIKSPYAGKVKEVRVSTGQSVAPHDTLIAIE